MKAFKFTVVSIFFCFTTALVSAQIEVEDKLKTYQILESQKQLIDVSKNSPVLRNQVFIQQIGSDNQIDFEISANSSNVKYEQRGVSNLIDVSINSNTYNSEVFQLGSNNRIIDEISAPLDEVVLNLTQEGQFQNFERYGSNSIGDKLEFKMTGDFNSIIVKNFK